ncbi:unnamed protein product [Eruca vesicaria subsp. sativa]|uniref:Uncharacterized protein n=1 Tax=Eruca vesicaria subsp. sativa TaxID=29727 RepID=A0ABC8L6G0_ERUVS|nr:unnamed protein product [Eruca vesicaria subsp. sativa]
MSAVSEWAASQNGKAFRGKAVAVNNLGKWKTATQRTALTILLASRDSSVGWLVASRAGLLSVLVFSCLYEEDIKSTTEAGRNLSIAFVLL